MSQSGEIVLTRTERVIFGKPAAEAVAAEAARLGAKRVFLHVSTHLNRETDEIERVRRALGPRHAATHDGMPPHAPRSAVIAAAARARAANADLVVSIGGGSVNDASKVMLIALKHNLTKPEELDRYRLHVAADGAVTTPPFEGPDVKMLAVPTTLSGGEFNPLAGSTDETIQLKQGYEHPNMAATTVILDPAIGVHTPEWLWMSTGVRALDHAIETLGSLRSNDFHDGIADSALRLLAEGLPRVKADTRDLDARLKCLIGVWQSMMPIIGGVPMGASHAIGHVLGGTCGVPHGYTSCVMSPYVLAWNASTVAERQRRISACFGKPDEPASKVVDAFIRGLGMPRTLEDVDVGGDKLELVARYTMKDFWARTNPRTIASPDDVMEILRMATG